MKVILILAAGWTLVSGLLAAWYWFKSSQVEVPGVGFHNAARHPQ